MTRIFSRTEVLALIGVAVLLATWSFFPGATSQAQAARVRHSTAGDLVYIYCVPPVGYESVGAQMYPCPRPTPPQVVHTYITYQPLMPQEFLYRHHRVYKTQHADAPRTRTSVRWR